MPKLFILSASLLLASGAMAAEIPVMNADFEEAFVGKRIPGWSRTQHAGVRAYEVIRDAEGPGHGKHSIRMLRTTEQAYGMISQVIESDKIAGKRVELTAALKTAEVGELGWVMVMTFMYHNTMLDQVRATPVTGDTAWKDVVLDKVAPKNATAVEIGFLLLDGGTGWADNVRLRTVEDAEKAAESPDQGKKPAGKSGSGKPRAVTPAPVGKNR
jgi:hypothetical protein